MNSPIVFLHEIIFNHSYLFTHSFICNLFIQWMWFIGWFIHQFTLLIMNSLNSSFIKHLLSFVHSFHVVVHRLLFRSFSHLWRKIHLEIHSFRCHSIIHYLIDLLIRSLFIPWFIYLVILWFIDSFIHSFTHLPFLWLTYSIYLSSYTFFHLFIHFI